MTHPSALSKINGDRFILRKKSIEGIFPTLQWDLKASADSDPLARLCLVTGEC